MNKQALRALCVDCMNNLPGGELNEEEFEVHWELLDARGLLGQPITFGPRQHGESERGLFSLDEDPVMAALVIGVLSNVVYDALKIGWRKSAEWMEEMPDAETILGRLGDLDEHCRALAVRVWEYARENLSRFIEDLRD